MNQKVILSLIASILIFAGCGALADKIDPVVKSGQVDQNTLKFQETNREG